MSDEAIERRLTELRDTAKKYAVAVANREYLEEFKKSKLSLLMKKYEMDGITSAVGQERDARADPAYIELLDGLRAAVEQSEALRWELKIAEIGAEVWRTQQASRRAERKGYGA